MFDINADKTRKYEAELLEIFILLEENNFQSSKEATIRYKELINAPSLSMGMALNELQQHYKQFMNEKS